MCMHLSVMEFTPLAEIFFNTIRLLFYAEAAHTLHKHHTVEGIIILRSAARPLNMWYNYGCGCGSSR